MKNARRVLAVSALAAALGAVIAAPPAGAVTTSDQINHVSGHSTEGRHAPAAPDDEGMSPSSDIHIPVAPDDEGASPSSDHHAPVAPVAPDHGGMP